MWLNELRILRETIEKEFRRFSTKTPCKSPNEMMKQKFDDIINLLANFPTVQTKQNKDLRSIVSKLQRLEDAMSIRLAPLKDAMKFDEITESENPTPKKLKSVAKSIKENVKIAEINGKKMMTIDPEKVDLWGPSFEEDDKEIAKIEKDKQAPVIAEPTKEKPIATVVIAAEQAKKDEKQKDEIAKPEKKKELFAVGFLDDTTMVMGFENGIKEILNRQSEYKNPKAAEMVNSFKNPLISFATNSKIFENLAKTFETLAAKKDDEKKKMSPTDKFFRDVNIFGSVEFDGDGTATNDLMLSLGFTKNRVEEIFDAKELEEESSVLELGDYQISKAIFYDLLNTLKAYKVSMSFKFEKQKLAALIENAPQMIEEIKNQKGKNADQSEQIAKTKIEDFENLPDILSSPKFYKDLAEIVAQRIDKKNERTKSK